MVGRGGEEVAERGREVWERKGEREGKWREGTKRKVEEREKVESGRERESGVEWSGEKREEEGGERRERLINTHSTISEVYTQRTTQHTTWP